MKTLVAITRSNASLPSRRSVTIFRSATDSRWTAAGVARTARSSAWSEIAFGMAGLRRRADLIAERLPVCANLRHPLRRSGQRQAQRVALYLGGARSRPS